jgi:hypothetical protein
MKLTTLKSECVGWPSEVKIGSEIDGITLVTAAAFLFVFLVYLREAGY